MESIDTEKLAQAENDCQSVLRSCKKQQNSELQWPEDEMKLMQDAEITEDKVVPIKRAEERQSKLMYKCIIKRWKEQYFFPSLEDWMLIETTTQEAEFDWY